MGAMPVDDAGGIATGVGDIIKPLAAVFGEYYDRDGGAFILTVQAFNDLLHVCEREFPVSCRREYTAPGIKDHDCLCAGVNLCI